MAWKPARSLPLEFALFLRLLVHKVPTMEWRELHSALPLAELFDTLLRLFIFVFLLLIVFAHRLKAPSAANFSRTAASTYSLWLFADAWAHLLTDSMVSGVSL